MATVGRYKALVDLRESNVRFWKLQMSLSCPSLV
jgi:hypothetical protein